MEVWVIDALLSILFFLMWFSIGKHAVTFIGLKVKCLNRFSKD